MKPTNQLIQAIRQPNRSTTRLALGVGIGVVVLGIGMPVLTRAAGISDFALSVVSTVLQALIGFLGQLLVAMVHVLIAIVQYNDFLRAPAVERGWVIVRDLGNMFFIVVLIMIAFGSILRIQGYRYNQWLFRIVLMALLVNFSKTIAGFFIDFAQVIMLTFVDAFKDTAAGNFTQLFGITKLLTLREQSSITDTSNFAIVTTLLLAVVFLTVALAVTVVYVVIFLIRIVAIWFLVTLSPMAYVLNTFKQGERYAHQWWDQFGRYLVIGPVLAFFLWLALTITAVGNSTSLGDQLSAADKTTQSDTTESIGSIAGNAGSSAVNFGLSEVGSSTNILNFIAGIVILVGALGVVQKMGGLAGSFATTVRTRLARTGAAIARSPAVQTTLGVATGGAAGLALATYGGARGAPGRYARQVGERGVRNIADRGLGATVGGLANVAARIPATGESAPRPIRDLARGAQGVLTGAATNLAILRGRQFGQRVAQEDAVKKDLKNLTDSELGLISRTKPLGEIGNARVKAAVEEIISRRSFDAAGYTTPEQKQKLAEQYENLSYMEKRQGTKTLADGKEVPWEYRTPRDKASADFLKTLYESNPTFDPDYKQFQANGRGYEYYSKKTVEQLSKLDTSLANDANVVDDLTQHYDRMRTPQQRTDFERRTAPVLGRAVKQRSLARIIEATPYTNPDQKNEIGEIGKQIKGTIELFKEQKAPVDQRRNLNSLQVNIRTLSGSLNNVDDSKLNDEAKQLLKDVKPKLEDLKDEAGTNLTTAQMQDVVRQIEQQTKAFGLPPEKKK